MLPSGSLICSNRPGQIGFINDNADGDDDDDDDNNDGDDNDDNDDGDDDDVLWMARRRGRKIAGEDALCGWWGLFPMIKMIKMRILKMIIKMIKMRILKIMIMMIKVN